MCDESCSLPQLSFILKFMITVHIIMIILCSYLLLCVYMCGCGYVLYLYVFVVVVSIILCVLCI